MTDVLTSPSALDVPTGDLVLRVCESSGEDRLVRLKSLKCSIGSGWHCTLRLGTHEGQGVNSLILQGPEGTIIRCSLPDVQLNGRPFTGADPAPGDWLSIGPVELEVLETLPLESAEDGEESIDQYMSRLMERVRASTDEPAVLSCSPPEDEQTPQTAVPSGTDVVPHPLKSRRPDLERMSPRAVAPESESGLSAMRELANFSARSAISHHRRRKLILTSRTKLAVAGIGFACCGVLAWLWWKAGSGMLGFYAAAVSCFIAVFWGIEYIIATIRIMRNRSRRDRG